MTFTEAAASEMKQRIRARPLADAMMHEAIAIDSAYASTIHGLGVRILTEHAIANGSSPAPRGAWRHPSRTAVFVGGLIDRGPARREKFCF